MTAPGAVFGQPAWRLCATRRARPKTGAVGAAANDWLPLRLRPLSTFELRLGSLLARKGANFNLDPNGGTGRLRVYPIPPPAPPRPAFWLRLSANEHPCWIGLSTALLRDRLPQFANFDPAVLPPDLGKSFCASALAGLQATVSSPLLQALRLESALAQPPSERPAARLYFRLDHAGGGGGGCFALSEPLLPALLQELEQRPDQQRDWWRRLRLTARLTLGYGRLPGDQVAALACGDLLLLEHWPATSSQLLLRCGKQGFAATADLQSARVRLTGPAKIEPPGEGQQLVEADAGPLALPLNGADAVLPALGSAVTLRANGQAIAAGRLTRLGEHPAIQVERRI